MKLSHFTISLPCLLLCCSLFCTACGETPEESSTASSSISHAADSSADADYSDVDFSLDSQVQTISEASVKEIPAGCTYEDIYNRLGDTANYGQGELHVWRLDTGALFLLQSDSDAICEADGAALLESAKVSLEIPNDLAENQWMGVLTSDSFAVSPDNAPMDCVSLSLEDTALEWEDGTTASISDCTAGTIIRITYTYVAESYPPLVSPTEAVLIQED